MRRKILTTLTIILTVLIWLVVLYVLWAWYEIRWKASFTNGITYDPVSGLLYEPQTVRYALLSGFFFILTYVFLMASYRMLKVTEEKEE